MEWIKQILRLVLVTALQALLIGRLQLLGVCHPYIYILFLLMFPTTFPVWLEMIIGAGIGGLFDILNNTPGVHMAACIALMYVRRQLLPKLIFDSERIHSEISPASIGDFIFIKYVVLLTLLHHTILFVLNAWSLQHIGWLIVTIVTSTLSSVLLIILYNLIKSRE